LFLTLKDFASFVPKRPTYAVFGAPVRHSLSPELQLAFAKMKGLKIDYLRIEITETEFPEAMELARKKLCGFNCTHPFKQSVLDYLDFVDKKVDFLQSCNTVHVIKHKFYGYNTDGEGFVTALSLSGVPLEDSNVLLLGCGGAASAIAYEVSKIGAHLTIAARDPKKADAFARRFSSISCRTALLSDVTGDYDIVINATPVGMASTAGVVPVSLTKLGKIGFVYDTIYAPPMTGLLRKAETLGIPYDNGLSMLVFQGAASQKHWFGHFFSQEEQVSVLEQITALCAKNRLRNRNLVLSGFMCAGKSTYGRLLANALDMTFVDTDTALEQEFASSVSDFFAKYGEAEFRKREAELVCKLSQKSGHVIALGGGAILNPATASALQQNAFIIHLDTPFEVLQKRFQGDTDRPLLRQGNIEELYRSRRPIYQKTANVSLYITAEHRALFQLLNSIKGDLA